MELNFQNTASDTDFLRTGGEMKSYKTKPSWEDENKSPKKHRARFPDEYECLGRNMTEQARRQNKVPWVKVKYISGKLYINPEKRAILRSMGLI